MSNPIFLDIEQVMTILLGEMPEGTYATDRADSPDFNRRSYSSSEIRAHAQVYANLYGNLQDIYLNKFISTVQEDEITRWESDLFAIPQNSALPFDVRKNNLLIKWRSTGGLSYPYIYQLVDTILTPLGLPFALAVYCGMPVGGWRVGVSPLDEDTYLSEQDPIIGAVIGQYHLDCNFQIITTANITSGSAVITALVSGLTAKVEIGAGITGPGIPLGTTILSKTSNTVTMSQTATASSTGFTVNILNYIAAGLTLLQLQSIQRTAYTYAVYIYGNADSMTLSTLDKILTQSEPGGSTHEIFNNAVPPIEADDLDLGGGNGCVLVDEYDCGDQLIGATYNDWDFSL